MSDQKSLDSIPGTATYSSCHSLENIEDANSATTTRSYDRKKQNWIEKEADANYFYTNRDSSFFKKAVFAIGNGVPPTPERQDTRINSIMTPSMALETFRECLDSYEKREIKSCKLVSHVGSAADKDKIRNYYNKYKSFDDVLGRYYILPHDHLFYRYEILKELQNGRMSQIVLAYDHERCQKVVTKIFRNEQLPKICAQKEIKMFWAALIKEKGSLSLPELCAQNFICSILNHFQFRGHCVFVVEKCSRSIRSLLDHGIQFSVSKICSVLRQICHALQFIHNLQIVHGSVCPQHVVQTSEKPFQIRLIDFSYSCLEKECKLPLHFPEGKQNYAAPELLLGRKYGKPSDVWGLACLAAEMITNEVLFKGDTDTEVMTSIASLLGDISPHLIALEPSSESIKRPEQPYFDKNGVFAFEGKNLSRASIRHSIPQDMFVDPIKSFLKTSLVYNPLRRPTVSTLVMTFISSTPRVTPTSSKITYHGSPSISRSTSTCPLKSVTVTRLAKRVASEANFSATPRRKKAKPSIGYS